MNGLNFQASVSNLTQVDRFQQGSHRLPMVNQEQNAQIAQDEASKRVTIPLQPDKVEGKKIDPGQRNRGEAGKKRFKKPEAKKGPDIVDTKNNGFLDIRI
jgi:hypothetical protein